MEKGVLLKLSIKKDYISPDFEVTNINLISDCLSASQPGGGHWGYFDEDPTEANTTPYDPGDDFWD